MSRKASKHITLTVFLLLGLLLAPYSIATNCSLKAHTALAQVDPSFTFQLVKGINGISMPFEGTGISTAEELTNNIPYCNMVWYWDAANQRFVSHARGSDVDDFPVIPGYPYFVNVTQDTNWEISGIIPTYFVFNLITTDGTDVNTVSLPLNRRLYITTAEDLANDIPYCDTVWYWDAEGQGFVGHPKGSEINNFPVYPGYPYFVNVTEDTTWPADDTPPDISITEPLDGSSINTTTPNISITFSDDDSGINTATFSAQINDVDSTSLFTVTATGASYQVTADLPIGDNVIIASINDNAENTGTATSNFRIVGLRAIPGAHPTSGYAPLTVYFTTNGEDPAGTIEIFRWDFDGDGTWDTYDTIARDYTHTYNAPETYNATLYVKSSTGQTATASITITVENNPPVATADAIPSNGAVPLTVSFMGSGTDADGYITLYEWDFEGDGVYDYSSNTTGNATHTYTTVGTHQAVFRVTDDLGATATALAVCTVVSVGPPGSPTASGSANPTIGDAPLTVSFSGTGNDPGGLITKYEWDFDGDGDYDWSSSTPASTSYTYNNPGTYTAAFRVTDNDGLTGVDYIPIMVGLGVGLLIADPDYTFDPTHGESMGIAPYFTAPVPASIKIKDQAGAVIRTISVSSAVNPPVFSDDMESGPNGWTHGGSNDLWQLGTPTYGPSSAHSGISCWGTNLTGNYANDMDSWLLSPPITPDSPKMLAFWHYFYSETYFDGGVVEVTTNGTDFTRIVPYGGYPYHDFGFGGDAYSGSLGGWSEQRFDLSAYTGQTIQIRFRLLSDYSITGAGWYIDDVQIVDSISVTWDGKDDNGFIVNDGLYYAILSYEFEGSWHELDLTYTTGGTRHDFPFGSGCNQRDTYEYDFKPFENDLLPLTFRLCSAQEVTAFIGPLWGGTDETRIRTIVNRKAFPAGEHTIYWDGLDDQGNVAHPSPGDELVTGFWRYDLPDNAIYMTGGRPVVTNISAEPNYFSPFSEKCDEYGNSEGITVIYEVSEDVNFVELRVYSIETGALLRTIKVNNIEAGEHSIFWDGKNNSGEYIDIGDYQIGIIAKDAEGNESMLRYTLIRIDY